MGKILFMTAMLAASTTAAPAFAQEEKQFHGPWIGVTAGYDVFDAGAAEEEDSSEDGVAYGVALGYDFNFGGFVAGVEGEISDSSVSASEADVFEAGDDFELTTGRDLYAGIRLGVPVSETVMIYGKGGYTNQRFELAYSLDGDVESGSDNIDGFRVGGGAELALDQIFARLEYRYSDYGSFSDADFETSRHQVMLAAGLRF